MIREAQIREFYEKDPRGRRGDMTFEEYLLRHQKILEFLKLESPILVLDLGCGTAELGKKICKLCEAYVGIDLSLSALKKAKGRGRHSLFVVASGVQLPIKNACFDLIVCSEVIEHIPKWMDAIKEMYRVLNDGGSLILTLPNVLNPNLFLRMLTTGWGTEQIYDRPPILFKLRKTITRNGFRIINFNDFYYTLPSLKRREVSLLRWAAIQFLRCTGAILRLPKGLYLLFFLRKDLH